jgi:hypothetical protein
LNDFGLLVAPANGVIQLMDPSELIPDFPGRQAGKDFTARSFNLIGLPRVATR